MANRFKAVFFDAAGTLFCPYPSVGEIYASLASEYGVRYEPALLEAEFETAWRRRGGLASLGSKTSEAKERMWWHSLVEEVFAPLGGVPDFEDFFDRLHRSFELKELWRVYPETVGVLQTLRARGLTLGIISNWDLRLKRLVSNLGLSEFFHFVLGSSHCGATKPSRKIFEAALGEANAKPEETLHVGDSYEEDFLGATQMGMASIHLNRNGAVRKAPKEFQAKSLEEVLGRV